MPDASKESALSALERLAAEAGAASIATDARVLRERLAEGRFYVAVVGQFKRGKSTLINALLDDALLPAGVAPVTAVVTVVRHGPRRAARVRLEDGAWRDVELGELRSFVSEEMNPENAKRISGVEVFAPSALLATGMCLVDTPGLGSVFASGTALTRAFVPHIDAAVVVLGADPPISEDELALVEAIARDVRELVFVLNKADRVSDAERGEARAFTERTLAGRLRRPLGSIFEVSAAERLTRGSDTRDWSALRRELQRLADEAGSGLVEIAGRRGLNLLGERLRRELDEASGALLRPTEESQHRIESLRSAAAGAERALGDLKYLLDAEQDRLRREFAARKVAFLERTAADAQHELSLRLRDASLRGSASRSEAIAAAQEISLRWVSRWHGEEQPAAEALYRRAAARFVELANGFLERLADSGEPALAVLPRCVSPELGFRVKSGLYFIELWGRTTRSPVEWVIDAFRTPGSRRRAVERQVGRYLETLVYTNATRAENDFNDRVLESRRLLEAEIRARLTEVTRVAEHALERARATLAAGSEAVRREKDRLEALRKRVDEILRARE